MKPITVFCVSCALLLPWIAMAEDKYEPPTIEKRVEPEYSADLKVFAIEPARVQIVIDPQGVPFSLESITSLPDNVVQAMSKWRFHPAKKNGTAVGYRFSVVMAIHRPAQRIERQRSQKVARDKELKDAFAAAKDLNAADAVRMEEQLNPRGDNVGARLTLLAFSRAGGDEATMQMRLRQILWLSINHPDHDVLAAPYATVSEASPAETGTVEAGTVEAIRKVWQEQLARHGSDPVILDHATNVLRLTNAEMVEHAILPMLEQTDGAGLFLGDLYGLAALGATAVDSETGRVSVVSGKVAGSAFAIQARGELDKTADLRVLFSALSTVSSAGSSLAKAGNVPDGYLEFCGKLLARAREVYPAIEDKCVATAPESASSSQVQAANLIKPERPSYPLEAKLRRISGTVMFLATIGKDGRIHDLEFLHGPLVLYGAARDSVLKWEYQPTRMDGVPVAVSTTIDVNFNLAN